MRLRLRVCILALTVFTVPSSAQGPATLGVWRAAELAERDAALSKRIGADHSARETLADYKSHRFRLLRRDADGFPEQHDAIVDVVIVHSGEGTLLVGGTMRGRKAGSGPGEYVGTGIDGGERRSLAAGDVVHIPPKVPHRFLVPPGKHLTYVLVKFPGQ
jgi:hypothetical protein